MSNCFILALCCGKKKKNKVEISGTTTKAATLQNTITCAATDNFEITIWFLHLTLSWWYNSGLVYFLVALRARKQACESSSIRLIRWADSSAWGIGTYQLKCLNLCLPAKAGITHRKTRGRKTNVRKALEEWLARIYTALASISLSHISRDVRVESQKPRTSMFGPTPEMWLAASLLVDLLDVNA